MKLSGFLKTWRGVEQQNKFQAIAIMGLVVVLGIVVMDARQQETIVTMTMPGSEAYVELAPGAASEAYLGAWAMFVANLLGNVNPERADFVVRTLEPLISSGLYRDLMARLHDQIDQIKQERLAISFSVEDIEHEPETDKYFVTGRHTTSGPAGTPKSVQRTFELIVGMRDYRPVVHHIDAYQGPPRTLAQIRAENEAHAGGLTGQEGMR